MFPWLSTTLAVAAPLTSGEVFGDAERIAFPTLNADNLLGEDRAYPDWYVGRTSLVFVVWTMQQQLVADTWLEKLGAITSVHPDLTVVEHPVVAPAYRLIKGRLDGWMRDGIPSAEGRDRTVTLFVGERGFAKQLGVTDRSTISVLLLDERGRVAKRWLGPASDTALRDVITSVSQLTTEVTP